MIEIGKKGVATMRKTSDDYRQLEKYIQDGKLEEITYSDMYTDDNKIIYRPELKADAEKLLSHIQENIESIINNRDISEERMIEKHKEMGKILGYPKKHIDYFCYGKLENKISKLRKNSLNKDNNSKENIIFTKLI